MPRVYEIARELGVTSREAMEHLASLGHPVTSHSSSIDEATAAALRGRVNGPEQPEPEPEPEPTQVIAPQPEPVHPASEDKAGEKERKRSSLASRLLEIPMLVVLAFVIAVVIKTFIAQAFYIPSPSMFPTLQRNDRVLVEKLSYRVADPARGHIVVFERDVFGAELDLPWWGDARVFVRDLLGLPTGRQEDYIKRIVAVGGDVIRYAGTPRKLTINGEVVDESYKDGDVDRSSQVLRGRDCDRLEMERRDGGCVVPAGRVFVLGDNRGNSEDSRVIGPIEESKIVGRAFVLIWPAGRWRGL